MVSARGGDDEDDGEEEEEEASTHGGGGVGEDRAVLLPAGGRPPGLSVARRPRAWWDRGRAAAADGGECFQGISFLLPLSVFFFSLFVCRCCGKGGKGSVVVRPGPGAPGLDWSPEGSRQRPRPFFFTFP